MGVLVADQKTFNNGLTLSNFVITIRGNIFSCRKVENSSPTAYRLQYEMLYYASQAAYESNNALPISIEAGSLDITDLNVNIYTAIYNNIKASYVSYTDI